MLTLFNFLLNLSLSKFKFFLYVARNLNLADNDILLKRKYKLNVVDSLIGLSVGRI